jgi:hypothetical protein
LRSASRRPQVERGSDLSADLREDRVPAAAGRGARSALVVSKSASIVLLVSAGLLMRALFTVQAIARDSVPTAC